MVNQVNTTYESPCGDALQTQMRGLTVRLVFAQSSNEGVAALVRDVLKSAYANQEVNRAVE